MDESKNKEALEQLHLEVHAIRLIPKYKASEFEFRVSKIISERFAFKCKECRERNERYKNTPVVVKKAGLMSRINNALDNSDGGMR